MFSFDFEEFSMSLTCTTAKTEENVPFIYDLTCKDWKENIPDCNITLGEIIKAYYCLIHR